jgi:hypothetical protein
MPTIAPRLHALAVETRALADLGRQKSRNLLQLQAHGERATALAREITAYGDEHGVPTRFVSAHTSFRAGAAQTAQGMTEARQGFVRFDWERVARRNRPVLSPARQRWTGPPATLTPRSGRTNVQWSRRAVASLLA